VDGLRPYPVYLFINATIASALRIQTVALHLPLLLGAALCTMLLINLGG